MNLGKESKIFIIITITIATSLFHLTASQGQMGVHMIHRELFFIPIVLSCFWFGLKPGLGTAGVISIIYASKSLFRTGTGSLVIPTLLQIFTFLLIAVILGSLVDHNEKFHNENIRKKELAALGNAALNLGIEIQDVLGALKRAFAKSKDNSPGKDEIEEGFTRLDNLIKTLTSFVTDDNSPKINLDINTLIEDQVSMFTKKAGSSGILIETRLDDKGCPSKVPEESIKKLLKDFLNNAIEASPDGGKIFIRTSHRPTYNILEIEDQGSGIKPEHLHRIFRPFFTTKEGSHGLSLASNYKFIKSCGGDMTVSSTLGKGTVFKIRIPIDDPARSVNTMKKISDWNPQSEN